MRVVLMVVIGITCLFLMGQEEISCPDWMVQYDADYEAGMTDAYNFWADARSMHSQPQDWYCEDHTEAFLQARMLHFGPEACNATQQGQWDMYKVLLSSDAYEPTYADASTLSRAGMSAMCE